MVLGSQYDKLHVSASAGFLEFCEGSIGSDFKTRKTENYNRGEYGKKRVCEGGRCLLSGRAGLILLKSL